MVQKHGLGRGLSSLIPPKKSRESQSEQKSSERFSRSSASSSSSTKEIPIEDKKNSRARTKNIKDILSTDKGAGKNVGDNSLKKDDQHLYTKNGASEHLTGDTIIDEIVDDASDVMPDVMSDVMPSVTSSVAMSSTDKDGLQVIGVLVSQIVPNTSQPRLYFEESQLRELAMSIKEHGVMQPLIVLKKDNQYELIAGERRLRASKIAGLERVPVIVRGDMHEQKKLELAILENVQRQDLNVIEEGKSYKKLTDEYDLTQDEIARKMGKSRSVIANRIRLASLPIEIQRGLIEEKISEGHAKVILSLENTEKQRGLYEMIISQKLTVREAERALRHADRGTQVQAHARGGKSPKERALEDQLSGYFGTKVQVKQKGDGGLINVSYFSDEELKGILGKLKI